MKVGFTSSKDIKSTLRFSGEYNLSDAVVYERQLQKGESTTLRAVTDKIFTAGRSKRSYVDNPARGIPYLGNTDLISSDPCATCSYVSEKYWKDGKSFLEKGMIVTGRVGQDTVGRYAYVRDDIAGTLGSDNVVRIVGNGGVLTGYLYAFLTSRYGYALTRRHATGTAQPFITEAMLADLPIPLLHEAEQKQIHEQIEEASRLRVEANQLLKQAVKLFEKENSLFYQPEWLAPLEDYKTQNFRIKAGSVLQVSLKARNHSDRVARILKTWQEKQGIPLRQYLQSPFTNGTGGFFKRIEDLHYKGPEMVSQSDLHKANPKDHKRVKIIRASSDDYAQSNMVLFPSVGNASGENEIFVRPTLAYKLYEGKLLSGDIGRFKCKTLEDAAYLFTAIKSKAGFRIFKAMTYGTSLRRLNWELIKNMQIPIASSELKYSVSLLVIKAYESRHQANELENAAISHVEGAIEGWQKKP